MMMMVIMIMMMFMMMMIMMMMIQSDRPGSQYWNSGMVAGHSELAKLLGMSISHFTEAAGHNKVCNGLH